MNRTCRRLTALGRLSQAMLSACSVVALVGIGCSPRVPAVDVLLTNGLIVDGTGSAPYRGAVGITGEMLSFVGRDGETLPRATRAVDVHGQVIAPGFIDMMGSSTMPLWQDPPSRLSKIMQGITTMVAGEGNSIAPQNAITRASYGDEAPLITWNNFSEYFELLNQKKLPINAVHNVGAAQVRRYVIGNDDKLPTAADLAQMEHLVDEAMAQGAVGLSTSLIYPPGAFAKTEELIALAKVAGRRGGVYFTHMRNESDGLLESIDETLRIGREGGLPVHIYHLKAAGKDNWALMARALQKIESARKDGVDITADIYPYIRNGIGLRYFVPPSRYAAGTQPFFDSLKDPHVRATVKREIEATSDWENWYHHVGSDWSKVLITNVEQGDRSIVGKTVAEVAALRKQDVWETVFDLIRTTGADVAPESMDEEQKRLALRADFVSFDTDQAPLNRETAPSAHPRAFATFPRIFAKYVRDENVITLQEAVRKATSLPAARLKLVDRGRLVQGLAADVVVFDLATIDDVATFEKPLQFPTGISYVFVNGEAVVADAKPIESRPGKVLRPLLAAASR